MAPTRIGSARRAPWADLGVVALGGAAGCLARAGVGALIGSPADFPLGILLVNVVGAGLLGLLVEAIGIASGERWRTTRLLLGTGLLGGFTTYSLLAADIAELILGGRPWLAAVYGLATLLAGGAASLCGILAARGIARKNRRIARTKKDRPRGGGER